VHRPASSTSCHDAARLLEAWRCSKDAASLTTSTQESRIEGLFRADATTSEGEHLLSLSSVLELALVTGHLVRVVVVGVEGLVLSSIEMALQRATCPRLSREWLSIVAAGCIIVWTTERNRGVRWPTEQVISRMSETNSVPTAKPPMVPSSSSSCPERPARDQAACAMAHQVGAGTVTERTYRLVLIQIVGLWELAS